MSTSTSSMATRNASSSSSSSSNASDTVSSSSSSSSLQSLMEGETCMYYARNRMSGCRWPRSCQSCLSTAGCMINSGGWCVSTDQEVVKADQDYELAIQDGLSLPNPTADESLQAMSQAWQFQAGKAKYCTTDDRTCQQCVHQNFWRSRNSYPDSHFCVGNGGCVCVDVCERRWYVRNDCPPTAVPSPTPTTTATTATDQPSYFLTTTNVADRIWRGMVGVIVFTVLFLLIVIRQRKKAEARERAQLEERRRRQEARRQRRHDRAESLGVNPLNLSGWETYRRDLIDKEKQHLAGGGDESKPSTVEDDESSGDESSDDEIRSPRAQGDASAAYVRMEEQAVGTTMSINGTGTSVMAHGSAGPAAQRDALPSLSLTAPIQRGA